MCGHGPPMQTFAANHRLTSDDNELFPSRESSFVRGSGSSFAGRSGSSVTGRLPSRTAGPPNLQRFSGTVGMLSGLSLLYAFTHVHQDCSCNSESPNARSETRHSTVQRSTKDDPWPKVQTGKARACYYWWRLLYAWQLRQSCNACPPDLHQLVGCPSFSSCTCDACL